MTICGYNSKIAEGLAALGAGMADAIRARSESTSTGVTEVLRVELRELEALKGAIATSARVPNVRLLLALNEFATAVFDLVAVEEPVSAEELSECLGARVRSFVHFIEQVEHAAIRIRTEARQTGESPERAMDRLAATVIVPSQPMVTQSD